MQPLDRLQGKKTSRVNAIELPQDSQVAVHGESYYQPTLHKTATLSVASNGERAFRAILLPEPSNQYDPNAIAVYSDAGCVGYLPREEAIHYKAVFEEVRRQGCQAGVCTGLLTGGTRDKPFYGVILQLSRPRGCLGALQTPG